MKQIHNEKLSKKLVKIAEDEALRQSLLFRTESLSTEKGHDARLDMANEKIKLLSGVEISIAGIKKFIADSISEYSPRFPLLFYEEIFRLHGWKLEDASNYHKPKEVAEYTRAFIYGRFPKEVLPVIEWRNPYVPSTFAKRAHKNFQFLTAEAREQLSGFIQDAIRVMKNCDSWHDFTVEYSNEFGLPFQLSLFDKNGN